MIHLYTDKQPIIKIHCSNLTAGELYTSSLINLTLTYYVEIGLSLRMAHSSFKDENFKITGPKLEPIHRTNMR